MRRTFSTFTIASCCRSLVPRWTMKSVRTSCAIALGLSWAGVGMADEIAGPANVNAATDPLVALKQLGSGKFPPYTWHVRANEIDFSIIDITGTTTPVRIASGTPTNTLRLKPDGGFIGNVGINGDPDDGAHLQINAPLTPVFRMAQSEAPFHDWDIIADHLDWRVRESGFGGNAPLGTGTQSLPVSGWALAAGELELPEASALPLTEALRQTGK